MMVSVNTMYMQILYNIVNGIPRRLPLVDEAAFPNMYTQHE